MKKLLVFFILTYVYTFGQGNPQNTAFYPDAAGNIPVWQVCGPYDYPLVGFGSPADTTFVDEGNLNPKTIPGAIMMPGHNNWLTQSVNAKKFLDLNSSLGWRYMTDVPVKIWYTKAAYAYVKIIAEHDVAAVLRIGSNSHLRVFLNGVSVHSVHQARNAVPDQDSVLLNLKKGENTLLCRVLNNQANLGMAFFGMLSYEWGLYARLLDKSGAPLKDIRFEGFDQPVNSINIVSTLFFKKVNGELKQRFDIELTSNSTAPQKTLIAVPLKDQNINCSIDNVPYGYSRHEVYARPVTETVTAKASVEMGNEKFEGVVKLEPRRKYEMHVMMLNHTDIGYTHPQPVVEEIHCATIDDAVKACEEYPDFRYTLETTWQLEAYEKARSKAQFMKLIELIKNKRVALSPIYANPYTGWVSEEELIRSMDKARYYRDEYGIEYDAAVYNDVPGQSWLLPQVLQKSGVKLVAEGINEFFGEYRFQRLLPKLFQWQGPDGSKVIVNINEAYNEGRRYGLESTSLFTIEQRLWDRLNKLEANGYKADIVLINTSFGDNNNLPIQQYETLKKWNEQFEYPKFVSSNVSVFAEELEKKNYDLPVLRGDFTSDWDIVYQGEALRMKQMREIQSSLLAAETISSIGTYFDVKRGSFNPFLSQAYRALHMFTAHGSGMEYGYGTPSENRITMDFRGYYLNDAWFRAEELLERGMHRLTRPEESLEAEGIYIFNTLSRNRDAVINFEHKFATDQVYEITDAVTKANVATFRNGINQSFIARNLPAAGFKKYILRAVPALKNYDCNLKKTDNSIENNFYKIEFEKNAARITRVIEKASGRNLLPEKSDFGFLIPLKEQIHLQRPFSQFETAKCEMSVIDESPVCLRLVIKDESSLITRKEIILYESMNEIEIKIKADLGKLTTTKYLEEYGLPFALNIPGAKVKIESLGGFMDENERLPGITRDQYSIRRMIVLYNEKESLLWSTVDARVAHIKKDAQSGLPVIISSVVNNYPLEWNRNETNAGELELRYKLRYENRTFVHEMADFGWESSVPPVWRKSWYRPQPAEGSFISMDNKNVELLSLKQSGSKLVFRLLNSDNTAAQSVNVTSKLIRDGQAEVLDLTGRKTDGFSVVNHEFRVTLKPGEFTDVYLEINK